MQCRIMKIIDYVKSIFKTNEYDVGDPLINKETNEVYSVEDLKKINEKMVVVYTVDWCTPCRQYVPIITKFCNENDIPLYVLDVNNYDKPIELKTVPCTIVYLNGLQILKFDGLRVDLKEIKDVYEKYNK